MTVLLSREEGEKVIELDKRNCPMRANNGNCLPVGGFCTAVSDVYCEIAHQAYGQGFLDNSHRIIYCKECAFATNHYQLVNAFICNNKNSPCNTHIVDDDFYCRAGKERKKEQE